MQSNSKRTDWLPAPEDLELGSRQVHIWLVSLELAPGSIPSLESSLSLTETERAVRFHFAADRRRFVIAHASLRGILAGYLRYDPAQLDFSFGPHGKPALNPDMGIEFNLAHSGEYALVAVARGRRLGIDVERIRIDNQLDAIARRFFSSPEVSELMALPSEQRTLAFFNCWTRKEAYIKAQGLGLSLPLDSFDVSLIPDEPATLRSTRPDLSIASCWILQALQVETGYAAALAVEIAQSDELDEEPLEFSFWNWASKT